MLNSLYQISEGRLYSGDHTNINSASTSILNCQQSHTIKEIEAGQKRKEAEEKRQKQQEETELEILKAECLAGLLDINNMQYRAYLEAR